MINLFFIKVNNIKYLFKSPFGGFRGIIFDTKIWILCIILLVNLGPLNDCISFQERFFFDKNQSKKSEAKFDPVGYTISIETSGVIPKILYSLPNSSQSQKTSLDIFQARDQAIKESIFKGKKEIWRLIEKIPFDSDLSIQGFIQKNNGAGVSIYNILENLKIVRQEVRAHLVVTELRLNLNRKKKQKRRYGEGIFNAYLQFQRNISGGEFPRFSSDIEPTPYTGLIVDMRGKKVQPSLFPKIYDESGLIIFDSAKVSKKIIASKGLVQYSRKFNLAKLKNRVGTNPFYLVALSVEGIRYKSDPVILRKYTRQILSHEKTRQALKNAKVVFLID